MNYRFVVPLLMTALLEQVTTSLVRVTTSYRVLELGLSEVWLGIITAAFAILPMVLAVTVGRFIDRGNEVPTAISRSSDRLISDGARMWKRYGAGPPSDTT